MLQHLRLLSAWLGQALLLMLVGMKASVAEGFDVLEGLAENTWLTFRSDTVWFVILIAIGLFAIFAIFGRWKWHLIIGIAVGVTVLYGAERLLSQLIGG